MNLSTLPPAAPSQPLPQPLPKPQPQAQSPSDASVDHVVLVFCRDLEKDPVSAHVLERVLQYAPFEPTTIVFDGVPVLTYRRATIHYHLVQLNNVLSHHYARYAVSMNAHFADVDAIILVNWHQGAKAPNAIFTVQTTGDMSSGRFSKVKPSLCRRLFLAVENARQRAALDTFSTWMEATHWSGAERASDVIDDADATPVTSTSDHPSSATANIDDLRASIIDLEIGSSVDDWAHPKAADVLACALFDMAEPLVDADLSRPLLPVLCIGGTHFEPGFTQLMRDHGASQGLALSHILPNHWLVAYGYDRVERDAALAACAASIVGGVRAVVFHDNLKADFKIRARALAEALGVPALSHKKLRTPDIATVIRDAQVRDSS